MENSKYIRNSKVNLNSPVFLFIVTIVLFIIYFSPYLIKGKSSYILIHDNLNQMNMTGIFDGKMNAEILPGNVDEHFTLPGTNAIYHLAHPKIDKIFFSRDYFNGFVLNEFIYRIIAFLGILFVLKRYQFRNKRLSIIVLLFSFSFITLPFWPPGSLSIAGFPLFFFAFWKLKAKSRIWLSYLFIVFYAFYSNFFYIGVFNSIILFIVIIYLLVKREKCSHVIVGFVLYLAASAISHYPIFLNELIYRVPTNRVVQEIDGYNLFFCIKMMIYDFVFSHTLSHSLHTYIILPSSIIITYYIWKKKDRSTFKVILPFWIVLIAISILYGLFFWQPLMNIYNSLNLGFRYDRLYVYIPILWFGLWSVLLFWLISNCKLGKQIAFILIIFQLGINFHAYTFKGFTQHPTFAEFTSEDQFTNIIGKIEKESRIGCIGFFPAVANYNGLKTIGSFSSYYPQEYKDQFRKIIALELLKNIEMKEYFDNKGSALFLFDDEIGTDYSDQEKMKQINSIKCNLDLDELKKFGVQFLLSTVTISNADDIQLKEIQYNKTEEDYYNIIIYKIE